MDTPIAAWIRGTLAAGLFGLASLATASGAPTATAFTTTKLPSGLEVIGLESHKVPLVTIVLAAKAGAMTETPDITGLTHLWEHMFFKGNARLTDQEAFNKRIRQLGISYNGDTAAEKVRYYFTLPSVFLDDGLQFMADAIMTPRIDDKELVRERRVVLNEYERNASQPGFDLGNLLRSMIYGNLENRRDPLGMRSVIEHATREQLLRISGEVFAPSNMALLVAGDYRPNELPALVAKHFGSWQARKDYQPPQVPPFPKWPEASTEFVMARPNVQNAHVMITFQGPRVKAERADTFVADVLGQLVDHRSGRFYRSFVDSGKTFEAGFSYYTQAQAGEIDLVALTAPKGAKGVEQDLLKEVDEWAKPGYFDQVQLTDVKRRITLQRKKEQNQPSELIKHLAFWWAVAGLDYYDHYLANIDKVTLTDVTSFVQRWLKGKPHIAAILVSPEGAKQAGLADTAAPLVAKYLSKYRAATTTAPQPGKKG